MRIIAGQARGRRLTSPPGEETRPTLDRVREAIFSSLTPYLYGAAALDAFAGSGAMGLEALSRGAKSCLFVENDRKTADLVKQNLKACALPGGSVVCADCRRIIAEAGAKGQQFDLIFLDPPYNSGLLPEVLQLIAEQHLLAEDGQIVAETTRKDSDIALPEGFITRKTANYGTVAVHYIINQVKED